MSIFPKKPIKVGDLVIAIARISFERTSYRAFDEPSLVLEIKKDQALVFVEQLGPCWYNITKLERVYVSEEFGNEERLSLSNIFVDNQTNKESSSLDK